MDAALDDVTYAKRGGIFKDRITELKAKPRNNDAEGAEQLANLRARVRAGSSGRSKSTVTSNSTKRTKSKSSSKQRKERKSRENSDASELLSPIQKMLQREAALGELEDGDLQKLREATAGEMVRRMSSTASSASSVASSASSASSDQRKKVNNLVSESDASSVTTSETSLSSFASASGSSPSLTQQQQDRRDRNRKTAANSKKNKNKSVPPPPPPPPSTHDSSSDASSTTSSTVSESLREKRQSLLSRIAAAKAESQVSESQEYTSKKKNSNAKSDTVTNAKRERTGGAAKNNRRMTSPSEDEGDASLLRYLERAVRSVGEQFQFGTMRVLPTDRREEIGIAIAESGIGAQEPLTVSDLFEKAVGSCGSNMAFKTRLSTGEWVGWTWQEYYFDVIKAAKAFINLGVQRWDSVLMAGSSSPEQAIAYFGAIFAGALPTILFPTDSAEVYVDVAVRTGAVMVLVENTQALDKFVEEETLDKLSLIEAFVMWGTPPEHTPNSISKFDIPVYHWEEFLALGAEVPNADLEIRLDAQRHGHACSIAVTPGALGFSSPKLVLLTHDNLTWSAFSFTKGAVENLAWGDSRGGERTLSLLPLANVATLVLDLYVPLSLAGVFERSQIVHFAEAGVGESVLDCMRAVRPTALFANPQVYDVLNDLLLFGSTSGMAGGGKDTENYANSAEEMFPDNESVSSRQSMKSMKSRRSVSERSLMSNMSSSTSVFSRSMSMFTGSRRSVKSKLAPKTSSSRFGGLLKSNQPSPLDRRRSENGLGGGGAKRRMGFKNHRDRLGLGHCKVLMSHGGTLPGNILNAFTSYNMHIAEAYGMAETSGLVSLSWPTAFRVGAVGTVTDSVELQCINSKTGKRLRAGVEGELVLRGRCVAMGYLDDQCRSDSTISVDGFLRTGDVGSVSTAANDGYLFLLGRVANRILLSGNNKRYIFPEPIERVLMSKLPMVQCAVVIGNQTHKHLTLLLTLAMLEDDEGPADNMSVMSRPSSVRLPQTKSSSSSRLLTTTKQRTLQRQASKREQNLAEHAATPRQAHHDLNSQHHHHPQFKMNERETSAMLAPRACFDGCTTLGQAKLNPTYMGRIQDAINWYNESALVGANEYRKIQGFTILDDAFSPEGERPELSASMIVNRPAVQEKYRNTIKRMHLPGFNSLKQSSYFGLHKATMAGKFDNTSGKFAFPTKSNKKLAARKSSVKQSVKTETRTDLTDIHREEVYVTKRGISKFVTSTAEEVE